MSETGCNPQSQHFLPVEQYFRWEIADIPPNLDYCMTEITLSTGEVVSLMPAPAKKFRGIRLPGAELLQADAKGYKISFHELTTTLFRLSLRGLQTVQPQTFTFRELATYIRLEILIHGELRIRESGGGQLRMQAGQYRITHSKAVQLTFQESENCTWMLIFLSPELLGQTPLSEKITASDPQVMSNQMKETVQKILNNIFEEKLRDAFYDYSIRELLFFHVSAPEIVPPGELPPAELSAVYAADQIITADLTVHHTINQLAKMVRTNAHTLKSGFAKVFGMGLFERLMLRRMERAKHLLEATDKQIQEISMLAGYETVTGFINAFRKQFKMSPRDWRKKSRGKL